MRLLLSSVGTRGDVQPIVALALKVRELGHAVRLTIPPNFVEWAHGLGFEAVPVGVEMRAPAGRSAPLTAEELRRLRDSLPDLVTDQFEAVGSAADGCDVILGANAHQYAARSIAELRGVPYVTALYAPVAIPSADHAPPPVPGQAWEPGDAATNLKRWADTMRAWNERALGRVNANRERLGLAPIDDVLGHNLTDAPWLAADPLLGPAPSGIFATGAWILEERAPLPLELAGFLDGGDAPVYFGFGSMPVAPGAGSALLAAARAAGRRAVVSRGWAALEIEEASDCIVIGDMNHQALFPRVAAIVHHGGAGTTAAAARAGVPQVVVPMFGDQFYWASRVRDLGIGTPASLDELASALGEALELAPSAKAVASKLDVNGAMVAAQRLVTL